MVVWTQRIVGACFVLVAISFVLRRVASGSADLEGAWRQLHFGWLSSALLLSVLGCVSLAINWRLLLVELGYPRHPSLIGVIWCRAQLAKYLPGSVWHIAARTVWNRSLGIPARVSLVASFAESLLLVVGALAAGIAFLVISQSGSLGYGAAFIVVTALAAGWTVNPQRRRTRFRAQADAESSRSGLTYELLPLLLPINVVPWIVSGGAFVLIVQSVQPIDGGNWAWLLGSFCMAWVIGFVTVLAPGGLGVREGILVWQLGSIMPIEAAATISLLSRTIWVVAELLAWGIFVVISTLSTKFGSADAPLQAAR